jgi:hypothetical protein
MQILMDDIGDILVSSHPWRNEALPKNKPFIGRGPINFDGVLPNQFRVLWYQFGVKSYINKETFIQYIVYYERVCSNFTFWIYEFIRTPWSTSLLCVVEHLIPFLWRTLSTPLRSNKDSRFGRGQPSREIFAPAWIFFKPARKQLPAPPENKKTLLFHSWRPLDYKSHIECTSPSRSQIQYICAIPPSK